MSADNGIYIARFKDTDGNYTYRVKHTANIENCDPDSPYNEAYPKELANAYRVQYFGDSKVHTEYREAMGEAYAIACQIEKDGGWTEYGICQCVYEEPFPSMSKDEAQQYLDKFWEREQR
jgi:hypothetical protein